MRKSLPELAMGRPVTVIMLLITLAGLGIISFQRTPVEFLPKFEFPFIGVWIPYPGAMPEQVEKEITIPAEGEFRTLSNLDHISSTSSTDGSSVWLSFDWSADMMTSTADVRDRMERLKLVLPNDIDRLFIRKFNSDSMPIMAVALVADESAHEFAYKIRNVMVPRLMRADGVADVEVFARDDEQVLIEFDQKALLNHGLSIYSIVEQLQSSSINLGAGSIEEGGNRFYVRIQDEFESPSDIEKLIVHPNGIRLGDVARVAFKARQYEAHWAVDGKEQVFMLVRKESEANTVATCDSAKAELERILSEPTFKTTQHRIVFNQADMIRETMSALVKAGKYGGLFALIVLFLFLGRIRSTLLVALSIPTSMLAGLVFMFFADITINMVTMSAMIIAVGMLVDNSIVVMENVFRFGQLGERPVSAARKGANEVAMAITASTTTTAVVFIPVIYMESGEMAVYMRQFAAPVCVALFASLLIALTVIPLAAAHMPARENLRTYRAWSRCWRFFGKHSGTRMHRLLALTRAISPMNMTIRVYRGLLGIVLRWRLASLLVLASLAVLTYYVPYKQVGFQEMADVDNREVDIDVEFEQNFDLESAKEKFDALAAFVDSKREELGINNVFQYVSAQRGELEMYLKKQEDLEDGETIPYTTKEVIDILNEWLPQRMPGMRIYVKQSGGGRGGGGAQAQSKGISLRLSGDDTSVLEGYADQIMSVMEELPNISEVEKSSRNARQEIQIQSDDILATNAGVTPAVIAQTVGFALRGTRLQPLKIDGREIPVWAQFREEDRLSKENLNNVGVLDPTGNLIPLNRLVNFTKGESPQSINRYNGKSFIYVTAKVAADDLTDASNQLRVLSDNFALPPGYRIEMGDEIVRMEQDMASFVSALILAIVLIFIVMSALFESGLLPLSILMTVPISFVGVYWILFLTGSQLDTISLIGCILMVGIVVNNGIVIVDHVNQLRRQGQDRLSAILNGGGNRFRPVMMTAITTILGCVPLAIGGEGGGEVSFGGLGKALIGGLTVGTILTLVVVPLAYTLIDDFQHWVRDFFGSILGLARKREATQ